MHLDDSLHFQPFVLLLAFRTFLSNILQPHPPVKQLIINTLKVYFQIEYVSCIHYCKPLLILVKTPFCPQIIYKCTFFLVCIFCITPLLSQVQVTATSTDNFQCDGVSCEYNGPSILINEVQMAPSVDDGSFYENATTRQGEWIELYNPDECKSIDISCYYLGNAATDGATYSGGYIIPQGTIVPPLGFVLIRGRNAPNVPANRLIANGGNTYEFTANASNSCIGAGGTRLWFPNAGGWFAFYDLNGVPQDAIRWGNPPAQDLQTQPCKASISTCGFTGSLLSFNDIPNGRKTTLQGGAVAASPSTFQRQPDGGAWNGEGSSSIGQCNAACVPIQTISCNGTVTANVQNGVAPYRYRWNDSRLQSTKTANGLCAGEYCVTVTDNVGSTQTICVTVEDFVPTVTLVEDGDLCEDEPLFPLTGGSPSGGVNGSTGVYSGSGVSGTNFNPASANIGDNEIEYVYVDSATCTDTATAIITVHPLPETEAVADKEIICLGETVLLYGTGADVYAWNNGVTDSIPFSPTETKWYVLTGTTIFGCELLDSIEIVVSLPLEAGVGDTSIVCPAEDFNLFDILTGYDIDGVWEAVESPALSLNPNTSDITNSDNLLPGTYNFWYIVEPDAPCLNDTATATIIVPGKPIISDVVAECLVDRTGYVVTFTISEGDPSSYSVSYPGTISATAPYTYISETVPSNVELTFFVSDNFQCGLDSVVTSLDCSCITFPGTMNTQMVKLCGTESFDGNTYFNTDSVNDGNDDFAFYLHNSSGFALANPLDSNKTGIFNFDPASMNYGQIYYVSTAMADSLPGGGLNYADVCFLVSRGTPVVWNPIPEIITGTIDTLCSTNSQYLLQVDVQIGALPIDVTIEQTPLGGPTTQVVNTIYNTSNTIAYTPAATTTYDVINYVDANACIGTQFPSIVEVVVDNPIVVDISTATNPSCASPSNPASITINAAGDETDFWVLVQNDLNGLVDTFQVANNVPTDFIVTYFSPNAAVTYTVIGVYANEPNVCPPVLNGPAIINPIPTANLSRDGIYCQADPIPLDFVFTGIGPWEVTISDGGTNIFTFTTPDNSPNFTTALVNQLQPGDYVFTITNIRDLTTGCTNAVGTGSATITVNPSPILDLYVYDNNGARAKSHSYCLGDGPALLEVDGLTSPTLSYNLTYKIVGTPDITYPSIQIDQNNRQFNFDTLVPGTYNVFIARVSDNSAAGCSGLGDTVSITINPLPTLTLNAIDQVICLNDSAEIQATLTVNPAFTFDILDGNGLDTKTYNVSGGNSFSFYVKPTQTGQHRYAASNLTDGSLPQCNNTTPAFADVYVNELPTATISGSGEWCEGTPFQIPVTITGEDSVDVVFDLGGITTLTQRFGLNGGEISATLPVGTHTITIVSVTDITTTQCVGSGFGPFTVIVRPTPTAAIIFNPDPVCLNETVEVVFSATGNGPFQIDYTTDLSETGTVNVTGANATISDIARLGMNYTITEIRDGSNPSDNLNYCQANPNTVFSPIVNDLPTGVITGDDAICKGEVANLSILLTGTAGFDFNIDDNFGGSNSFTQVPTPFPYAVTPDTTTVYTISNLADANGCVAVDLGAPFTVTVFENPDPIFQADPPTSCAPLNTKLLNLTSNVSLGQCNLYAGNNTSSSCNVINDDWNFETPGSYDLNYSLTSVDGCNSSGTITGFFTAFSNPIADFIWTPSQPTTLNNTLQLTNKSTEADSSYWEITDAQNLVNITSNSKNPIVPYNFSMGNDFTVYLYVETVNGCKDSITKIIPVKEVTPVYIPNAFTPNGDGVNEGFRTVFDYSSAEKFNLEIFNRWGEKIFQSDDPEEYWDGIYRFEKAKPDVYVVRVTLTFDYSPTEQVFEARVTLVR